MMLDVFRNHEKRLAEESSSSSSERSQHLRHRTPNPLPRHPGRAGPPVPGSKMPSLHPSSVPMQLASNVMVVPPQQIAASSSQQAFLSAGQHRKRLAVAHPIMRHNPNFNPSMAHNLPKTLHPQRVRMSPPRVAPIGQDSPLDLSAPLDLSVKRKKDPAELGDLFQQSASKKLKMLDSANKSISGILSKPPPIYPGLQRAEQYKIMRQQRKVQPLVQNTPTKDPTIQSHHQKYFHHQPKASTSRESEEVKLRYARQVFAMQNSKIMTHNSNKMGPDGASKEPQLPVKRVQAAVPPLVTSSSRSSNPQWPPREPALAIAIPPSLAQRLSEHERMLHEEKKNLLLARAAAMGIPVDQEVSSYPGLSPRSTPQLIKENGAVDSEMEDALRRMMQRSREQQQQRQSPKPALTREQMEELKKRQAYSEYVNKQLLLHSLQQQTQQQQLTHLQEGGRASSSSSPHPPLPQRTSPHPRRHPSPQLEKQTDILKRQYLYEMSPGCRPPSLPAPPAVLPNELVDSKMKLVQGVGANSGPQYRLTLKDFDLRQNPPPATTSLHAKHKADSKHLKTYQYRAPDAKKVHDYIREYHKVFGDRSQQSSPRHPGRSSDHDSTSRGEIGKTTEKVGASKFGLTASRGPLSRGLPHPVSKLSRTSLVRPASTHPRSGPPLLTPVDSQQSKERCSPVGREQAGSIRSRASGGHYRASGLHPGAPSSVHASASGMYADNTNTSRSGRKLLDPEEARSHILAGMNPAFTGIFHDQDKKSRMMHSLRRNCSLQQSKGFALNIKEVIAREISKCIDENYPRASEAIGVASSSKASEVIDLTDELSEGSPVPEVSGRVGSPQSNLPAPVVIENLKQDVVVSSPPPLIKASSVGSSGFVPLVSNSVITSGTVSPSEPFAASIKKCAPPTEFATEVPASRFVRRDPVALAADTTGEREEESVVDSKSETCSNMLKRMAEQNKETSLIRERHPKTAAKASKMAETTPESGAVFRSETVIKREALVKRERPLKKERVLKTVEDFINEATRRKVGDFIYAAEGIKTEDRVEGKEPSESLVDDVKVGNMMVDTREVSTLGPSVETVTPAVAVKSVSYDPRRKVLAALSEQQKFMPPDVEKSSSVEGDVCADASLGLIKYPDTKIVPRADQDDRDCKLPDQLLEDDDDDTSTALTMATDAMAMPEKEAAVAPVAEPSTRLPEEPIEEHEKAVHDDPEQGEQFEEEFGGVELHQESPPDAEAEGMSLKPRRKRRRRVRRYYQIIPRRTSARRGTKRKPPQTRRNLSSVTSKTRHGEPSPPLQVRTRNSEGRRRLAAMASSYHRDTRYEQEIEKEEQKVMERRRRRRAVVQSQDMTSSEGATTPENDTPPEGARRRRCRAVTSNLTGIERNNGQMVDAGSDSGYGEIGPHMELKVRIQRKNLTGRFQGRDPHEDDIWQVVEEAARQTPTKGKACRSLTYQDEATPSTSGLGEERLRKRARKHRYRRKDSRVRRQLLEARVLLDQSSPSVPPVPKELKRLCVNKKLGETLLHKAARLGHDEAALYYIDYCSQDLNAKDNAGYTPLHECCVNGRLKVAKHMIAKGADVNGSAADGTRPVHDAIDNERVELARLLLAHGGDPLIATYSGRTTRKLARSQETKSLIHGYLRDINGRLLAAEEELEEVQRVNFNIRFHSSVQSADDVAQSGVDYMSGAPASEPCGDEFMLELSDEPMLPSISMYLEEPNKYSNWLLLGDVLQRLRKTRADFMYCHRDIKIHTIKKQQLESAALGQDQVKAAMTKTAGKTLEFVELNDHIRRILGTEIEYVR